MNLVAPAVVAAPTITPNGGSFSGSVSVAMQTTTSGASIYYTTTGSTPTQSSSLYTGPLNLTNAATVKAIAVKSGASPSGTASAAFTFSQPTPPAQTSGTAYYVGKTGSDSNNCTQARSQSTPKLTINVGLSCLASGDTLDIGAGTYDERLYDPAIPNGSSFTAPTTIRARAGETVIIKPTYVLDYVLYLSSSVNKQFIVFNNIIWDGTNTVTGSGPNNSYTGAVMRL